ASFREAVIYKIEKDGFVLLIAVEIVEFPQVGRQEDRFAPCVFLDLNSIESGGFVSTDLLWRPRSSRCEDWELDFISLFKIIHPQIEFPKKQFLLVKS